jgi:MoxR-like ATPase
MSTSLDELMGRVGEDPGKSKPRARKAKAEGWQAPRAKCWDLVEAHLNGGVDRVLLFGIPGTGKTYSAHSMPFRGDKVEHGDVFNIYVREDSSEYQIVGTHVMREGNTVWEDGPALLAFNHSWVARVARLVVNEITNASADALHALMAIADDPYSREWMLPTGQRVAPNNERFQIIATTNVERENLPHELGEALADRFVRQIEVTHPHPDAINALPEEMRKVAYELTHSGVDESQRVSIRAFRAYSESIALGIDRDQAGEAVFGKRAQELIQAIHIEKSTRPATALKRRPKEVSL